MSDKIVRAISADGFVKAAAGSTQMCIRDRCQPVRKSTSFQLSFFFCQFIVSDLRINCKQAGKKIFRQCFVKIDETKF